MGLARGEIGFQVSFFDFDKICKLVGVKSVPTEDAFAAIRGAGFSAVPTHYRKRTLKTDASIQQLVDVFNRFKNMG
jgi:tRNA G26 N,N-dimethylase Trm1